MSHVVNLGKEIGHESESHSLMHKGDKEPQDTDASKKTEENED